MKFKREKKNKEEVAKEESMNGNVVDSYDSKDVNQENEKGKSEKINKKFHILDAIKINPSSTLGKYLFKAKEAKVKRELRQIEKGAILVLVSLVVGYFVYQNIYLTVQAQQKEVSSEERITSDEKTLIETQLLKKNETATKILRLQNEVKGFEGKYPNYRTKNEVLLVLNNILGADATRVSSVSVNSPVPVKKADIYSNITRKKLNSFIKNIGYFESAVTTDETETPAAGEETADIVDTKFELSETTFTIADLGSIDRAVEIVRRFYESDRVLIPSKIKINGEKDKYSIEGTILFYAYRGSEKVEELF